MTSDNRNDCDSLEYWAPVRGYEGRYSISSHGRVKSHARCRAFGNRMIHMQERFMAQHPHIAGYSVVWLRRPGEHVKHFVHRLVADAFIPNPHEKGIVNHMDRNKTNNHHLNLEWVDARENTAHWMALDAARAPASLAATVSDEDLPF